MAEQEQRDYVDRGKELFLQSTNIDPVGVHSLQKRWGGLRSPKRILHQALHLTPKPGVHQEEHTLAEVVKFFPAAAVYLYGKEGVVRFAVHEKTIVVSLLARDGLYGHIVPVTDIQVPLSLNRITYTLGQPFEVPYTGVDGVNKLFSISQVNGVVLQRNQPLDAGIGEINYIQTVPPHGTFYEPPKL